MAYWWVREWAGFWMMGFIITSLTLTQPATSTKRSSTRSPKDTDKEKETESNASLSPLKVELEDASL